MGINIVIFTKELKMFEITIGQKRDLKILVLDLISKESKFNFDNFIANLVFERGFDKAKESLSSLVKDMLNDNPKMIRKNKSPYDTQVGGSHYKTSIQPVQYSKANNLNFNQGNIVKYISRYKKKNGMKDLEKIIQYTLFEAFEEYPDEYDDLLVNIKNMIGE